MINATDWLEEIADSLPSERGTWLGLGGSDTMAEVRIKMPDGRIARLVLTFYDEFDTEQPIVVHGPERS